MKKNLFLLFSFYFFVLQPVFIGLLRGEPKFYWLALVNCVFICLIAIFAKDGDSSVDEKSQGKYENNLRKESELKISHFWIFLISFLFGILVIFWLKDIALYLRVGAGIIGAIIVFLFGGLIFNYKTFRVWEGKFYLILLILTLIRSVIKLLNIDFSVFQFSVNEDSEAIENLESTEDLGSVEENMLIPEEEVVVENNTGDILVGADEEILENLGEFAEFLGEEVALDDLITFEYVIKYLLKNEKLSTKTDLVFSYIGKSNPDYAYYRTAYEKKMIGKDLQPTKNLMCETYVVMKGLAEEWSVGKYSDIKQAYWDYAKDNGLSPSCDYGEYVKYRDLIN